MQGKRCIQGRWLDEGDILELKQWIDRRPGWSRKRLAKGVCEHWQWRDARGRLKDFAARSLLLKLEGQGRIELPPLQENQRRPLRCSARPSSAHTWRCERKKSGPLPLRSCASLSEIHERQSAVASATAFRMRSWPNACTLCPFARRTAASSRKSASSWSSVMRPFAVEDS